MNKNIIAPFQIKNNKVVEFSFKQTDFILGNVAININFDLNYSDIEIVQNETEFLGQISVTVDLKGVNGDEELFSLFLKMKGLFTKNIESIESDISEKEIQFEEMLKLNGATVLVQLCRAYITSVTALTGIIPPLNIPMIDIYEFMK